jgi:two-component system sensor histidine kinase UhpB
MLGRRVRSPSAPSLFRTVFAVNALALTLAAVLLAFTPVTIDAPVSLTQALILVLGLVVMLALNLFLLRGAFGPLKQLEASMRQIDPLRPGRRIVAEAPASELASLIAAFNEMAERLETERRESARQALAAQEGERRRLGRELHDQIGQTLTAVMLQVDRASRVIGERSGTPGDPVAAQLAEAADTVRASLEDVRRIARELRPEALDDLGLASGLMALCSRFSAAGLRVMPQIDSHIGPLDPEIELVVYRVAQEALTNVARHAGTDTAELRLTLEGGDLRLLVSDRGRGLPEGARDSRAGIGGMRERALLAGGRLAIRSRSGEGTEIDLRIPIGEDE